jgi:SAM-dependent methyltransferase
MHADEQYSGAENLEVMREAENYNRFLLNTVRRYAPSQGRVLDFGAGDGQFAIPLSQLGYDLTALEPDAFLRGKILAQGVRAVGSLSELDNDSLEYVYSLNVLEHIQDDVGALKQLTEKMRAGSRLLIYVPAFPLLYTEMDAKVGHVRRYTRNTLGRAAEAAGLIVETVDYADSLGFFATLAFKMFGNRSGSINRTALRWYDRAIFPLSRSIDHLAKYWIGKNLLLIARKPSGRDKGGRVSLRADPLSTLVTCLLNKRH